jgi:septal ring factor EnvC (AmiA/AmiB activator)
VPSIEVQHTKLTKKINELDALKEDQVEHTQTLSTLQTQSTDLKKTSGELDTKITDLRNKLTAAQNAKNTANAKEAESRAAAEKASNTATITVYNDYNYTGGKAVLSPGHYTGSTGSIRTIKSIQLNDSAKGYTVLIYGSKTFQGSQGNMYIGTGWSRIISSTNRLNFNHEWNSVDGLTFNKEGSNTKYEPIPLPVMRW